VLDKREGGINPIIGVTSIAVIRKREALDLHLLIHPLPILWGYLTPECTDDRATTTGTGFAAFLQRQSFDQSI
jgi:hypothetical protein